MSCCGTASASAGQTVSGAVIAADDMSCGHCVGTIEQALRAGMPGVRFAVDLAAHRVTVAGDGGRAAALIRDAGYSPVLLAG